MGERVRPRAPKDATPIVVGQCRPYIKIEKDPTAFAACNVIADKLGPINTPKKAVQLIGEAIGNELNEVFGVAFLDIHLRFKGLTETGRGEPASVMAPIMPTLQASLINGAHAVVIWHCHPSGVEAEPSQADKDTTKAFAEAFEAVDIILLDHIICAGHERAKSYFSFAEAGLL